MVLSDPHLGIVPDFLARRLPALGIAQLMTAYRFILRQDVRLVDRALAGLAHTRKTATAMRPSATLNAVIDAV